MMSLDKEDHFLVTISDHPSSTRRSVALNTAISATPLKSCKRISWLARPVSATGVAEVLETR